MSGPAVAALLFLAFCFYAFAILYGADLGGGGD